MGCWFRSNNNPSSHSAARCGEEGYKSSKGDSVCVEEPMRGEVVRAPPLPRIVMRVVGWRVVVLVVSWGLEREDEMVLAAAVVVGSEADETLLSTLVTVLRSIVSRRSSSLGSVGLLWA